jgi:hypothetical protein
MAHYKCPTSIEVRDALARTATGKLQKFKLRERAVLGRARAERELDARPWRGPRQNETEDEQRSAGERRRQMPGVRVADRRVDTDGGSESRDAGTGKRLPQAP